tara:strand:- start:1263 stop:2045 length:783 start_codon:yes stop_codon:yes gene_type:complete
MGYLGIYNNILSGNTFRVYLSDYGRSVLGTGNGLINSIQKFGLGDLDIDYRRFVGSGTCSEQSGLSALTGSCFYDLTDERGGEPNFVKRTFGVTPSVFKGPRTQVQTNVISLHNTSLGVNPTNTSTLWAKHKERVPDTEIEEPNSGNYNTCWEVGHSVTKFYPAYCISCADFNGDGVVDMKDLKTFLNLLGSQGIKGSELTGDFNGDGKVDKKDLMIFIDCLKYNDRNILNYCKNKEIYCLLCKHLGSDSPCGGDCLKCI